MPSGQSNVVHSLAHTKWNCKYHSERYMKFAYRNREFWCKGYYVDIVGKTTTAIKQQSAKTRPGSGSTEYIRSTRPVYGQQVTPCMAVRPIF